MMRVRTEWIVAGYCAAVLTVYAWKPSFTNASQPVRGITDPVIALEMARTVDDVDNVLGDTPSPDREVMRIKQYVGLALIPGYTALAWLAAASLGRRGIWKVVGRTTIAITVLAAAHDVAVNLTILRLVDLPLAGTGPKILHDVFARGFFKWALLALAMGLLGVMVSALAPRIWLRAVGWLAISAAALTAFGLFQNAILIWGAVSMVTALLLMAATLKLLTHESVT